MEDLEKQLKNPEPIGRLDKSGIFERAVYWLLTLSGYNAIKLDEREFLYGKNRKRLNSIDILAFNPREAQILLIGCTTGVPDNKKIARIKISYDKILKQYPTFNEKTIPIYISSEKLNEEIKTDAIKNNVKIIDQDDLMKILHQLKLG